MWKWIDAFFEVEEPPKSVGFIGYAMMAVFGLFCAVVWFLHSHR